MPNDESMQIKIDAGAKERVRRVARQQGLTMSGFVKATVLERVQKIEREERREAREEKANA